MLIKNQLFVFFIACATIIKAQNITAFNNSDGAFSIFDNGLITYKEYNKPLSFKVGGNCVAFIDAETIFKIYYKGQIFKPYGDNLIDNYRVTHNLVLFTIRRELWVFDNGVTRLLDDDKAYNYAVNDSLVVFQEPEKGALLVYSNGEIDTLALGPSINPSHYQTLPLLKNQPIRINPRGLIFNYKTGKNILAFTDSSSLKIFYRNKLYTPLNFTTKLNGVNQYNNYECAGNMVGYINPFTKQLCAFYKGQNFVMPTNYLCGFSVGDDMLLYTDSTGLHVFYDAKIYNLSSYSNKVVYMRASYNPGFTGAKNVYDYKPTYATSSYIVKDGVVIFSEAGQRKVFCKGFTYELGDVTDYIIDNASIVWTDNLHNLNTLYNGKICPLSTLTPPNNYSLNGNVVWLNVFPNQDKVFFNGKMY